jgi:hypothetical protein
MLDARCTGAAHGPCATVHSYDAHQGAPTVAPQQAATRSTSRSGWAGHDVDQLSRTGSQPCHNELYVRSTVSWLASRSVLQPHLLAPGCLLRLHSSVRYAGVSPVLSLELIGRTAAGHLLRRDCPNEPDQAGASRRPSKRTRTAVAAVPRPLAARGKPKRIPMLVFHRVIVNAWGEQRAQALQAFTRTSSSRCVVRLWSSACAD